MVAILEKGEHNTDFHPMVDFLEASPLRYALTVKPTVYVSHLRHFWSTAKIETTEETNILTTVDGIVRTVFESSLRRNLKLRDEEGISSLPDAKLFENLTLMGYNISPNQNNSIMARLLFYDYHNMVAILEKGEYNTYFHPMVDFLEASPIRIKTMEEGTKILATVDGIVRTIFESSLRRNLKLQDEEGISSLPDATLFENLTLMGYNISPNQKQYTRRTRIAQSFVPLTVADEPAYPQRDASQEEACPTDSNFIADQDRATIDKKGVAATNFGDDAPIKGKSMDKGKVATERVSDDTEEMETVLTSMDAATVLASGVVDVPTGSGSIPTASTPAEGSVPTGSEEVPIASPVFATATVVTPDTRRKEKEVMVESETPKKQKVQEQIDAQ
nr:hypothetical protein [Tanacetum cinerariifolium]